MASRIALACAAFGAVLAPAAAADLGGYPSRQSAGRGPGIYVPPYFSWTGFYLGGFTGYGGGTSTSGYDYYGNSEKLSLTPNGWLGGAQIGYNWQSDSFVFGLEGDGGYLGASDGKITATTAFANTDYSWYGTATARLGFSESRWLIYAKGGLAFANIKNEAGSIDGGAAYYTKLDDIRTGWALGGGAEFAFQRDWSMKVEYLYMDFGKDKSTAPNGDVYVHENAVHTGKVGLNYHLQQSPEPLR